jgi:hypothetical protein
MANWYFVDLAVIGVKKDVNAFNRIALSLPVLSDYVITRNGKPITSVMFEDMVFEKPEPWGKHWWSSWYRFQTRDLEPVFDMMQDVSKRYSGLCFRLDWDFEHEEFGTRLVRGGRVESHEYDAESRREALYKELTSATDGDDEGVDWEIDTRVAQEFSGRFDKLWRPKIYRTLYSRRRRGEVRSERSGDR